MGAEKVRRIDWKVVAFALLMVLAVPVIVVLQLGRYVWWSVTDAD